MKDKDDSSFDSYELKMEYHKRAAVIIKNDLPPPSSLSWVDGQEWEGFDVRPILEVCRDGFQLDKSGNVGCYRPFVVVGDGF